MSANYKLVRTPNSKKDGQSMPYHARFVSSGTLSLEEFIKVAEVRSSFSPADIKGVLQLLQDLMVDCLKFGYNIRLEGIGTFSLSIQCPAVMDKKKIRSESVHFRDVTFRSAVDLRKRLKGMPLFRAKEQKGKKTFSTDESRRRMLTYLDRYRFITRSTYMQLNHCCQTKAVNNLNQFCREGILVRHGRGPTTFYMQKEADVLPAGNVK